MPEVKFFRHSGESSGITVGLPFGINYLSKQWSKACKKLGIEGLDLYGGTRHTAVTELAKRMGEVAAKDASGHRTSKAFNRYCQVQGEMELKMAQIIDKRHTKTYVQTGF